jgi:hypothetical protein
MTKLRRDMFTWLKFRGKNFLEPVEDNTNYLTDYDSNGHRLADEGESDVRVSDRQADGGTWRRAAHGRPRKPFPLNNHFVSQPILSEELREEIWRRVTVDKKSIRIVSVELGVEMRRVGAVVRLFEVEKQWRAEVSRHELIYSCPYHTSYDEQPKFD